MEKILKYDYPLNMNKIDNLLLLFFTFLNVPIGFIMSLDLNFIIGIGSGLLMIFRNRAIIGVSIYEITCFIFVKNKRKEIYKIWRSQLQRQQKPPQANDKHKNDLENEG
jgi:hypothetical protein